MADVSRQTDGYCRCPRPLKGSRLIGNEWVPRCRLCNRLIRPDEKSITQSSMEREGTDEMGVVGGAAVSEDSATEEAK